ncbi:MAG: phytanoyl-CoA dioxygenase family protein, partial [Planctomycetota bacterium]
MDLADRHDLVSNLIPSSTFHDLSRHMISSDQIEFFNEYGYLSGIKLLEAEQVNLLLNDLKVIQEAN